MSISDFLSAYENLRRDTSSAFRDLHPSAQGNGALAIAADVQATFRNAILEDMGRTGGYRCVALIARLMSGIANAYRSQEARIIGNDIVVIRANIFTGLYRATPYTLPRFGFSSLAIPHPAIEQVAIPQGEEAFTRITQQNNAEHLADAEAAIRQYNDSLSPEAGARDFFERGVRGYVATLRQSIQQLPQEIQRLSVLPEAPEVTAELEKARKAYTEAQEQLDGLDACMPESYLGLLNYVVFQAVRSELPLIEEIMEENYLTQELPLGLHNVAYTLEALRQNYARGAFTDVDRQTVERLASSLQQGNLELRVGVTTALSNYLESDEFKRLLTVF